MTTLNDLNGYLDDEAYTVRVGELRALLAASTASDKMTSRERFEEAVSKMPGHPFAGAYLNLMWKAWQAALANQSAEPVAVVRQIEGRGARLEWLLTDVRGIADGTQLYAAPNPSDKQEAVAFDDAKREISRRQNNEIAAMRESQRTEASAQSAEQDRIAILDEVLSRLQDAEEYGAYEVVYKLYTKTCADKEMCRGIWQAALESRVLAERKPIYQVDNGEGGWIDVGPDTYRTVASDVKRIVFTHPTPDDASVTALREVREMLLDQSVTHLAVRLDRACRWIDAAIDRAMQDKEPK